MQMRFYVYLQKDNINVGCYFIIGVNYNARG